jgi:PAS domain-containing protein
LLASRAPRRDDLASRLRIFPSTDEAFAASVRAIAAADPPVGPEAFQARLRRFHPKTVVRRRVLEDQPEVWYLYRDGAWAPAGQPWWQDEHVGRITVSADGWVTGANAVARGLLGIAEGELGERHFTDFVAPGTLRDAENLYRIIASGAVFEGTVLVRAARRSAPGRRSPCAPGGRSAGGAVAARG